MKERIDDAEDLLNLELDQRCGGIRVWVGLHVAPRAPHARAPLRGCLRLSGAC